MQNPEKKPPSPEDLQFITPGEMDHLRLSSLVISKGRDCTTDSVAKRKSSQSRQSERDTFLAAFACALECWRLCTCIAVCRPRRREC